MACFTCTQNSFRDISRAMAKSASARLRSLGVGASSPDFRARLARCQTCTLHTIHGGVSYCGTPFLRKLQRDSAIDGCGCPVLDKAKSPGEHCPLDNHFRRARTSPGQCNCRWCLR